MQIWMPSEHHVEEEEAPPSPTLKLKEIIERSKSPVKKKFVEKFRAKEVEEK